MVSVRCVVVVYGWVQFEYGAAANAKGAAVKDLEAFVEAEPFFWVVDAKLKAKQMIANLKLNEAGRVGRTALQDFFRSAVEPTKASMMFSSKTGRPGALKECLEIFANRNVNLLRIESRPSTRSGAAARAVAQDPRTAGTAASGATSDSFDFHVTVEGGPHQPNVQAVVSDLKPLCDKVELVGPREVSWFPTRLTDLDLYCNRVLSAGAELEADHPGFRDAEYRARRKMIADRAERLTVHSKIDPITYTKDETATWGAVHDRLWPLLKQHACEPYLKLLPTFEKEIGYRRDNIPQLQDISDFLRSRTGFFLRPVAGLLSARDFLNGLAFRCFFSTQYIRHHSRPLYTPEPDLVHELVGHAPLFADPDFADFSQEIGLASIGASDDDIQRLARCYWYTVEFGVCLEKGVRKAYGAGLLSSFGELGYAMELDTEKPQFLDFNPFDAAERDYPITTYQPLYYVAKSFEDAKVQMSRFASTLSRAFNVSYNARAGQLHFDRDLRMRPFALPKKPAPVRSADAPAPPTPPTA